MIYISVLMKCMDFSYCIYKKNIDTIIFLLFFNVKIYNTFSKIKLNIFVKNIYMYVKCLKSEPSINYVFSLYT